MTWLVAVSDGVTAINRRIDRHAFSPDGTRVAFWCSRRADVDLVERERVFVVEIETGREVMRLDGPDIVRALVFVGDDALLVQRDFAEGAWLGLHAVPDGGLISETLIERVAQGECRLQVSADQRTVYASSVRVGNRADRTKGVALRLPAFEVIFELREFDFEVDVRVPGVYAARSSMDPEGETVAVGYILQGASFLSLRRLSRPDAPRILVELVRDASGLNLEWIAPSTIHFGARRAVNNSYVYALDPLPPGATERVAPPRLPSITARGSVFAGSLDPDRSRLIGLSNDGRILIQSAMRFESVSAYKVAFFRFRPGRSANTACWSSDGRRVIVGSVYPGDAQLVSVTTEGKIIGRIQFETPDDVSPRVRALSGGTLVLDTLNEQFGGRLCFIPGDTSPL